MSNPLQQLSKGKISDFHLFAILVTEAGWAIGIAAIYPILSMLLFGEGNNSFMYSKTNNYLFIFISFGIPVSVNVIIFFRYYRKADFGNAKDYLIAQTILVILYLLLTTGLHRIFHY